MKAQYEAYRSMTEKALEERFSAKDPACAPLREAMAYSLLGGGKRLRAVLALEFCRVCGGKAEDALPFACALEMLHAYSLIHDDLPCMDDSDMRRGKPSCHTAFGEWMALLAGDALQAEAFGAVLSAPVDDAKKAKAALYLARAAGCAGICGGQYLDLAHEGEKLSAGEVELTYSLKTAALIKAAALMGCAAAGASPEQEAAAEEYAEAFGRAFQVRDDMLDKTATPEHFGKNVGKDENKTTFLTLFGERGCAKMIDEYTQKAVSAARSAFGEPEFLVWLAESFALRDK